MPQAEMSKEREMGTFRLIPSTLALRAVQRQRAASKSTRPFSKLQHWLEGGVPTTMLTKPRRSAQTPSLRVSIGQEEEEGGVGTDGLGQGFGFGFGLGGLQLGQAVEMVERRRRERTKMAEEEEEDIARVF